MSFETLILLISVAGGLLSTAALIWSVFNDRFGSEYTLGASTVAPFSKQRKRAEKHVDLAARKSEAKDFHAAAEHLSIAYDIYKQLQQLTKENSDLKTVDFSMELSRIESELATVDNWWKENQTP